ncbi:hypothetical protein EBZ39_05500 [bacterium]|nr:hypothetical protein [bacterium]
MPAADKKKSLTQHIRDEIVRHESAGELPRNVEIVNSLAARRIIVSPAQVSQVVKKYREEKALGAAPSPAGRRPGRPPKVVAGEERSRALGKLRAEVKAATEAEATPGREAVKFTAVALLHLCGNNMQLAVAALKNAADLI